jgi:hypothetical protein
MTRTGESGSPEEDAADGRQLSFAFPSDKLQQVDLCTNGVVMKTVVDDFTMRKIVRTC